MSSFRSTEAQHVKENDGKSPAIRKCRAYEQKPARGLGLRYTHYHSNTTVFHSFDDDNKSCDFISLSYDTYEILISQKRLKVCVTKKKKSKLSIYTTIRFYPLCALSPRHIIHSVSNFSCAIPLVP